MPNPRTLLFHLRHPGHFPFLWRLLRQRLKGNGGGSLEESREQSTALCESRVVERTTIVGIPSGDESFASRYASLLIDANSRAQASGQKLGGAADASLLFRLAKTLKAQRVLETGVAYGWSSLALLLAIRENGGGTLISTNLHYREYHDESAVGCVVPEDLRADWDIYREADGMALPKILRKEAAFDLCHYDSDKSYAGRMKSYPLLWQGLRVGGTFVSDDIGDNLAFFHFARMVRQKPIVIKNMPIRSMLAY